MSKFSLNNVKFLHKLLGTDPNKKDEMQPTEVLSYSVAGFGQNMICQLVTSFFLFYLTDAVGLNPIWLAIMFLGARLFDAFNDPVMGWLVDRTRSKYGKMRPYLKWSPLPIAIFTVLMFVKVTDAEIGAFIYATIIYLLWGICYTTVDVPYWSLATSMTADTEKRNNMLTVARLICTAGAGLVTVLIPIFQGMITKSAAGDPVALAKGYQTLFLICAVVVVVIALPTFFIAFKNTNERYYDKNAAKVSLKHNVLLLFKNKQLLLLIGMGVLGCLRLVYMTSGLYYAKYNLGKEAIFSTLTLLVVPGGLIASLTTPWLSKKIGKKNLFIISHLVGGAAMLLLYFVGLGTAGSDKASITLFYVVITLLGLPSGYSNILSYSMIADTVDYLEDKTGERAEGICFSMQTFISKIGMAFTAFVVLLILGTEGYADSDKVTVTDNVKDGIWMMTTLLSGLSTVLCTVPLFFYTFTEKKQKEAVARIAARKAEAARLAEEEAIANGEIPAKELTDNDSLDAATVPSTNAPFTNGFVEPNIEQVQQEIKEDEEKSE